MNLKNSLIVLFIFLPLYSHAEDFELWLGESVEVMCPIPAKKNSSATVYSQFYNWTAPTEITYKMGSGTRIANLTVSKFFLDTKTVTCKVTWYETVMGSIQNGPYSATYRYNFTFPKVKANSNQSEYILTVGDSQEVGYQLTNQPSNPQPTVSFSTSDPQVATVNNTGIISAKSPGVCDLILSTNYGTESSAQIIVKNIDPQYIYSNFSRITLFENEQFELKFHIEPISAGSCKLEFNSLNPEIASVDECGIVTAHSFGSTKIIATTPNNISASCFIDVKPQPIISVDLNQYNYNMFIGDSTNIMFKTTPENSSYYNAIFSIHNPSIISVDDNGQVKALNSGTTLVDIYIGDAKATLSFNIREKEKLKLTDLNHFVSYEADDIFETNKVYSIKNLPELKINELTIENEDDENWQIVLKNPTDVISESLDGSTINSINVIHTYKHPLETVDLSVTTQVSQQRD